MCEKFQKTTISKTASSTHTPLDTATHFPCDPHHGVQAVLRLLAEEFFEVPAAGNLPGHKLKVNQPGSVGPWKRHIAEAPTVFTFLALFDPYPFICHVNGFGA